MKKRFLSLALALVMCLSLLPITALAADVTDANAAASNPYGLELPTPAAPDYYTLEFDDGYGDELKIFYMVDDAVSTLMAEYDTLSGDEFTAKYSAGRPWIYLQYDISVDGPNNWNHDASWDTEPLIGYYSGYGCSEPLYTDKADSFTLFSLHHMADGNGDALKLLEPIVYSVAGAYEARPTVYRIDTANHSLYIRCRYIMQWTEVRDGVYWDTHYQASDWSEAAVVGKGSTQRVPTAPTAYEAPIISELAVHPPESANDDADLSFVLKTPDSIWDNEMYYLVNDQSGFNELDGQVSVNGGEWTGLYIGNSHWPLYEGLRSSSSSEIITSESYVQLRVRYNGPLGYSPWSNVLSVNAPAFTASPWATEELQQADELGLIPEVLQGADLTQSITRAEFAAVAVKAYEALSSKAALPIVNNPFTDCNDVEVLKAYNIGAVNGTSATTFEPNALLNREQAAAMLTRVFKAVTLTGWTLATDGEFSLPYTKPAAFADDADISDWAKDSVYFMAANGIIGGVGDNRFAPKNITTEEQATGYANATREQALIIAVRMVQNLGQ